jgi:exopolyphosphatase / guanosine-5'-triphosphate,3'-diphosphate pyrophosphatase
MLAVSLLVPARRCKAAHAAGVTPLGIQLDDRHRQLLEAAAVLHDVGYLISYASHHKHSFHLIMHADLPGWSNQEVQTIANVARYHRAAEPKPKHQPFAELDAQGQAIVRVLSGILRVADGLDRTHSQSISHIKLDWGKSGAVTIRVSAAEQPSVDLWGSERKSGLFAKVLGKTVAYEWKGFSGSSKGSENVEKVVGKTLELHPTSASKNGLPERKKSIKGRKP